MSGRFVLVDERGAYTDDMARRPEESMRVRLSDDRRAELLDALRALYRERFDEDLSDFRATEVLDFFVRRLGPPVYNQAIQDACSFMNEKIADLDAEYYEPDASE